MFAMWQPLMIAALSATRVRGVFYRRSHDVASGISCPKTVSGNNVFYNSTNSPSLAAPIYGPPDHADIAYKVFGKRPLLLDIYLPQKKSASGSPALIRIHGGGWYDGSKLDRRKYEIRLLEEGVAIVDIDYRLSSENTSCYGGAPVTWPAQGEDVEDAVRWLKKNGPSHGIDPDRLGCWGDSAGGHLCNWLAVAGVWSSETRLNLVVSIFGFTCFLCSPYTDQLLGQKDDHVYADNLFGFSEGTLSMLKKKESAIEQGALVEECDSCQECGWDDVDTEGKLSLGGSGHTEAECQRACTARWDCNFAAISEFGYCHMFKSCNGKAGKGWKRWKKEHDTKLQTALALVRSAEPLFKLKDAYGARIPRFFIAQGEGDEHCSPDEGRWFTQGLTDAGAAVELTMVAGGAHAYQNWEDWPIEQAIAFVKHKI